MRLLVPVPDPEPWPTLGFEIVRFIEDNLVHGPGDVLGDPVQMTDEAVEFVLRAYEIYPKGHPQEGRRRFKRAVLSRRKGWSKTELAAWVAICEMDPTCPVRFDGWKGDEPVGRPVRDPYIPMVAYTEDQTEDLAYAAVYEILARSKLVDDYDVGLERIQHNKAPGKIQALASAPSARDGARTTFQHSDETHLFNNDRLRRTHATMQRNLPKRKLADAWSLETTTSYAPGEDSIAERAHEYAMAIAQGRASDARLLYDHLQADDSFDIRKPKERKAATVQASGDAIAWADLEAIDSQLLDPTADENENRRFWWNQPRRRADKWGPAAVWPSLKDAAVVVEDGADVVLGFDGSYSRDSTALIGCTVSSIPHVFEVKVWERTDPGWRVPRLDVEAEISKAMERWHVVEFAPDPPGWHSEIEVWEETYGETVQRFDTMMPSKMGPACDAFEQAVRDGQITHDGSETLARHLMNAVAVQRRGWTVITKDGADSPHKIDAAVAAIIAHFRAAQRIAHPLKVRKPLLVT